MPNSPRMALPYVLATQAQKELTHNDAVNDVDSLAQISVMSRTLATPPASPVDGDSYIIAASPTGAWAGQAGAVASYYAGWRIKTPKEGWVAWIQNEDVLVIYDGTAWNGFRVQALLGSAAAPAYSFAGDTNTGVFSPAADVVALATGGTERVRVNATEWRAAADNTLDLGTASQRWKTVYAVTGTINTSDARQKDNIAALDGDFARAFVKALPARTFQWKDGAPERFCGFIAQDVAAILAQMGKSEDDFAGLVYDKAADLYGLRSDQFIPILWQVAQQLIARIERLEAHG